MAAVAAVGRRRAEADHRRVPEAAGRLVRAQLAASAQLALGATGVGLRLHLHRGSPGIHSGRLHLNRHLVVHTATHAGRPRRDVRALQAEPVGATDTVTWGTPLRSCFIAARRHGSLEGIVSIMGASRTLTSRERALYRASTGLVLAGVVFIIL